MENESKAVDRAIAQLHQKCIFTNGQRRFEVRSLIPVSSWRPLTADWWRKKEACVIGEDIYGNLILRVCDGTVRLWNWEHQEDEVLSLSVRDFLSALHGSKESGII